MKIARGDLTVCQQIVLCCGTVLYGVVLLKPEILYGELTQIGECASYLDALVGNYGTKGR